MSYDAFYEKLEENTFVALIMKHPVLWYKTLMGPDIFHFPTLVNFGPPYYKVVIGFEDIFLKQKQNKSKYIQAEQGAIQPQKSTNFV